MAQVWKFPIEPDDRITILMPAGAKPLSVQVQHGTVCLWALVEPAMQKTYRAFKIFGTGHDIPEPHRLTFVGTFQLEGGTLVFHLFEQDRPAVAA